MSFIRRVAVTVFTEPDDPARKRYEEAMDRFTEQRKELEDKSRKLEVAGRQARRRAEAFGDLVHRIRDLK